MGNNGLNEYVEQCGADNEEWFPDQAQDIYHHSLAMVGEVGEFANILKKVQRGTLSYEEALADLREELIDVFIYWAGIAYILDLDAEALYTSKREFNADRFST